MPRYLQAGLISLALLLLSRVMGLARESAMAAAFGTTALADAVVVILTLPDVVTNVLATGALGFVLLPWWARQRPQDQARSQGGMARVLVVLGLVLLLWIGLLPGQVGSMLAPGLEGESRASLLTGLRWAALALPATFLAALWYTRLQQDRDVIGMYGMNVVHTGVIIAALWLAAGMSHGPTVVHVMGASLLLALVLRLLWLYWRMQTLPVVRRDVREPVLGLPPLSLWAWAILATGVPVAIPLLARSLVSSSGDGALATFNYAWRLIELPNQFAIQLVTTLAFPAMTRAHAEGRDFTVALRSALVLAWTLACASAVALHVGAQPLAQLLFGWGRMQPEHVAEVARWSAWGAWTLLPQALIAVMATVLATLNKMKFAAVAYALALMLLWLANGRDPREVMMVMTLVLIFVAAVMLLAARRETMRAMAWLEMAQPALLCILMVWLARWTHFGNAWLTLLFSGSLALGLTVAGFVTSPVLRALLRR